MTWDDAISAYLMFCLVGGHSPGTIRLRRHYLHLLASRLPAPWSVTGDDLIGALACTSWSPETRKSARSAVRSFYAWAVESGKLDRSPAERLPKVHIPTAQPRPAPESVLRDALVRCRRRERLMLLMAAYAGMRRSEIAASHLSWFGEGTIRIKGKGGRVRTVPLHPAIAAELVPWECDGFLFPGRFGDHITADAVGRIVADALGGGWTAHTLRHRFASGTYAAERDLLAVGRMLGHSRPETTSRYVAIPDGAARSAVLALPGLLAV